MTTREPSLDSLLLNMKNDWAEDDGPGYHDTNKLLAVIAKLREQRDYLIECSEGNRLEKIKIQDQELADILGSGEVGK